MKDTFNNELKFGDDVVYMHQWYDGRWESFHKGTVIGFTPCFVKIQINEKDRDEFWTKSFIYRNGEYGCVEKPYILRQPHKLIKI